MRSLLRSVLSLLLIAGCAAAMYVWPPSAPSAAAPAPSPAQGAVNGKKTEVLKGDAAKLRVLQLLSKNKGFRRAMKAMEKMGKKPNWDLSIVILRGDRAIAAAKSGDVPGETATFRRASYSAPQETFYGNEGEMTFVTYDGPEHSWDGTIYGYDYATGETQVYNGVIYDHYAEDPINWELTDEVYYPPDGSEPIRSEPCSSGFYCLQEVTTAEKKIPQKDTQRSAGRFVKTSFAAAAGAPAAKPARPVLRFIGRFFTCFFRAAPFRIGQCPPAARFTTCLITGSLSAGVCCGGAAYHSIGNPTGSGGYCYP